VREAAIFVVLLPLLAPAATLPSVPTPRQPVTDVYHGVAVVDDYQWLETTSAPAVREWTRLENERTRAWFAGLPFRDGIAQQLMQLRGEESARYSHLQERNGRIFALRFKPPAQQPVLVRLSSLEAPALWRTVFDPNAYNTNGTTSMDWYVASPDGRLVAISLSEGGSEQGTLHFFEVETGRKLADVIPRVQYPGGGGSAAWTAGGAGIFYTRYPHERERPAADIDFYQQVWFHRIGTPVGEDQYSIGKDFPRIAEVDLETSADGQWVLASVANGDGGDFAHYVRDLAGKWQQVTRFEDGIKRAKLGRDGALYLLSRKNAPRGKVLRLPHYLTSRRPQWPRRRAGARWRSSRRRTTACMSPACWAAHPRCSITSAAAPGPARSPFRRCQPCRGWTPGGMMMRSLATSVM
jgi:prolyl oligopeptidase